MEKEQIYFYRTISGRTHFSNGQVIKDPRRLSQYLRMLHYAGYPVYQLFLDNPEDFNVICNLFHITGTTWQQIYNEE